MEETNTDSRFANVASSRFPSSTEPLPAPSIQLEPALEARGPQPALPRTPPLDRGGFWSDLHHNLFLPAFFFEPRTLAARSYPLLYLCTVTFFSLAVARLWSLGFTLLRQGAGPGASSPASLLGDIIGVPLAAALLLTVAAALLAPLLDRSLWLLGAADRERLAGRIISRSASAFLAALLPVVGIPLALAWGLVLMAVGFHRVYGVGPFQLFGALLLSLAGMAFLLVLPFLLMIGAAVLFMLIMTVATVAAL